MLAVSAAIMRTQKINTKRVPHTRKTRGQMSYRGRRRAQRTHAPAQGTCGATTLRTRGPGLRPNLRGRGGTAGEEENEQTGQVGYGRSVALGGRTGQTVLLRKADVAGDVAGIPTGGERIQTVSRGASTKRGAPVNRKAKITQEALGSYR